MKSLFYYNLFKAMYDLLSVPWLVCQFQLPIDKEHFPSSGVELWLLSLTFKIDLDIVMNQSYKYPGQDHVIQNCCPHT